MIEGGIIGAIVALIAAFFGYTQWQRAKRAEKTLETTRKNTAEDIKTDRTIRDDVAKRERENDIKADVREAQTQIINQAEAAKVEAEADKSKATVQAEGSIASELDRLWEGRNK